MRAPLRITSDEDRQYYRQGIRTLALLYAGILVLVVAVTSLRVEWRNQEVTAKATTGAVTASDPGHPLSAALARDRTSTQP